jgi:hypothetical protein
LFSNSLENEDILLDAAMEKENVKRSSSTLWENYRFSIEKSVVELENFFAFFLFLKIVYSLYYLWKGFRLHLSLRHFFLFSASL